MGPVEEAGKAANTFMDALKAQPLSLALVAMNCALLFFIFYWANVIATQRQESVKLILEAQKQVNELLSRCIVPERRTDLWIDPPKPESKPIPLPTPIPIPKEP